MDQQTEITVEVTLKPSDVYTPFRWDRGNVTRWVLAALLCLIFRDLFGSSGEALRSFPDGGSIFAVVVVLLVFILLAILLFPYLRVHALFRKPSRLAETTRITFRPDKILFQTDNANSECKWTIFTRVYETRKIFAFSQGNIGGTYVPKRFFSSPDEVEQLRQMIRQNLKGKWTLRRD
ncbi:MAG TPA: YcxB family protein [Candidatus Acidoferrum sp.]